MTASEMAAQSSQITEGAAIPQKTWHSTAHISFSLGKSVGKSTKLDL